MDPSFVSKLHDVLRPASSRCHPGITGRALSESVPLIDRSSVGNIKNDISKFHGDRSCKCFKQKGKYKRFTSIEERICWLDQIIAEVIKR